MIAPSTPAGKRVMAIAAAELEIRRRASASAKIAARGRLIDLDLADFVPAVRGAGYERPEHLAPLTDFFDRVSRGEVVRMLCSAPPQFGKALADDTPIWTQRGWISVGEVVVGDMLVGSDGQWTRVNGVFPQGEVDLYDVAFVGGTVVRACGEHRWAVRGRYSNRRYVKTTVEIAADLTEKDGRHKWRVPIVAPAAGTPCELPIDPYVLGAWLGDGTSRAAALTSADEEIVEAFRAAGYPTSRVHTRGAAKTYSFLGGLRVKLRELGVLGPGLKHIPERYLTAPPEARLALLQGIADTDGTAAKNGRSQSICTTSERLARDYKTLISSLGGFWREYTRPAAGKTAHNIYVRLPKGMSLFRLGRKANRVLPTERFDHRGRLIADVLPAGRGTATCFSVAAKDHLFCAGADLVVTHNSVVMSTGCARYVARQPDRPIIYATYGASLAEQKSREARDIAVECGVELRSDASSVDEWLTPQGGGMRARGVGGPTIGHPAKCFIGATRVQTPQGVKTIADVARGTGRTLVLSFDHAQGRPVWRSVLASQRSVSRSLVEIETVGGKRLRCTSDHPIFVLGRGYVPAGELRSNDLLRTANLRGVLPAGVEGGHSLPGLFPRPQALRGVCSLHVVRREDLQAKLRAREGETQRHPVGVLLSGVHGQALSGNDGCSMQGVRDIGTAALEQEVLFERLPDAGSASGEDQAVRGVRSEFSSGECSQSVLREEVRVGGAFEADARRGQFTFQDRGQLREAVPRDASARVGTGRESVRGVREAGEPLRGDPARPTNLSVDSIGASHRSRPEEQRAREPRHVVQDVPRGSPQVGVDSVAMVRELRGESDEVFDIEVEGTHNFFAEGLLVHNCFIVDDPHKDREEAESALLRQKTFDWYVAVAESRCHPDSSILVAHCMVGDTPVLMADGREKPLRDVRAGDIIATYAGGTLTTSVVRNWANQGADAVFSIRTKSGIIVRANERHPFLVNRKGNSEWVKLRDLRIGDEIVRASASGANGEASLVRSTDVANPPSAKGSAPTTTTRRGARPDTTGLDTQPSRGESTTFGTDTGSTPRDTTPCFESKADVALSAKSFLENEVGSTGPARCSASITTTVPGESVGSSVTSATSRSATGERPSSSSEPLSTYAITRDPIVAIVADRVEDVFDIEVEKTENFIANGLVSHNSRWHDDDLIGRLKELQKPDGTPLFEYYNLPAILPSGEPLWYQRPLDWLAPKQQFEHDWWSLWMGAPRKRGERVLRGLRYYEPGELPGHYRIGKGVDLGGYTSKRSTHHSVAVVVLENLDDPPNARRKYVVDVQRVKEEVPAFAKRLRGSAWPGAWRFDASAQERGIAQLFRDMQIDVDDYLATTDKLQRAQLLIAEWNAGRVLLPARAPWLREFADELLSFTGANDKADDQVDAAASAFENLRYEGGVYATVDGAGTRWGDDARGFG